MLRPHEQTDLTSPAGSMLVPQELRTAEQTHERNRQSRHALGLETRFRLFSSPDH